MKDIALLDMDRLKKKMVDSKRSPRSIEYTFAVIRHIFNRARHHNKFAGENPLKGFKFPKPDNARMRFLTHEEADALLNLLKEKSADVHDMTLLSLHCGLRFGEIAALTWHDVDLERGTLTIRDAKAGSRYAFLTEQAAEMLRTRPKGKPSNYVFIGRAGQLKYISLTFKRAVDELKLNNGIDDKRLKIVFHSARHSYASWLIEEGVDLFTVQKLLGHKTNVMTQRYAHMAENRLKGAANALSKAFQKHDGGQVVNFKK